MSDIFISYKHEDESHAALLKEALERAGLDVWWDKKIPGGERWRERLLTQLESAKCVLVLWSAASTGAEGDFVMDEASRARQRGTLLQIRIEDVSLPLGFGEHQGLNLIGWNGSEADPGFQDVLAAARAVIERRPVPPPQAPRRRKAVFRVGGGIALVSAVLAVIMGFPPIARIACRIPGVRGFCGEMGLGGAPSRAEESLWSARPAGDCDALRSFLSKFPGGAYASEAQARLAAATFETKEAWTPAERRLPLAVRSSFDPFPSEQAARADALARAPKEAEGICATLNQDEFRLQSARAVPGEWRCSQRLGGYACAFDGEAVCEVSVQRVDRIEKCP